MAGLFYKQKNHYFFSLSRMAYLLKKQKNDFFFEKVEFFKKTGLKVYRYE